MLFRQEVCVSGMGRSAKDAAVKDVPIGSLKEECVSGMEQRSSSAKDAAVRDVPIAPLKEECVSGTGRSRSSNYAAVMDVIINLR